MDDPFVVAGQKKIVLFAELNPHLLLLTLKGVIRFYASFHDGSEIEEAG